MTIGSPNVESFALSKLYQWIPFQADPEYLHVAHWDSFSKAEIQEAIPSLSISFFWLIAVFNVNVGHNSISVYFLILNQISQLFAKPLNSFSIHLLMNFFLHSIVKWLTANDYSPQFLFTHPLHSHFSIPFV